MGYPSRGQLGDFSTEIADALANLRNAASTFQTGAQQLSTKLNQAGASAVKLSNQATGAAAGAKVGAQTGGILPTSVQDALRQVPTPVWYGVAALVLYKLAR